MNFLRRPTALVGVAVIAGVVALTAVIASASSGSGNGIAPYKQAVLNKVQHDQQAAQSLPHLPKNPTADRPTAPPTAAPQGIFPYRFGPFPSGLYNMTNLASIRTTNGTDLLVYAGAMTADTSQGVLIVVGHAGNSVEVPADLQKVYASTRRGGALTITALGRDSVTFTYALGGSGAFDLLSRKFS